MFDMAARLSIGDLVMKMGAHVRQRGPEAGRGCLEAARGSGGASNPRRANDHALRIGDGNLVGHVPDRRASGVSQSFEPVDNAVAGQHLFVVEPELIGQERRGEIVVGLAEHTRDGALLIPIPTLVIESVLKEEGSIDPQITALPILDPREHVGKEIQELGEVR